MNLMTLSLKEHNEEGEAPLEESSTSEIRERTAVLASPNSFDR
jgi:hypothetical protein